MALSQGKKIVERPGQDYSFPVAANAVGYQGGLVMLDGGVAKKAAAAGTATACAALVVVGVAQAPFAGGVADGDVRVPVRAGLFLAKNSAGVDAITEAHVGKFAYVVDDETVARTSAFGLRPRAGVIADVEAAGVWVEVEAESRAHGRRTIQLPFAISETDTLAGTSAELISPVVGEITGLSVIVQKAVTTGGPVTAAVGVTAVAGLSCVIADGAVKGTIVSDTPTAGDATTLVNVGSRIQAIPDAAFATAGALSGFIEITF